LKATEHACALLDVFTDVPLTGNQLVVVHDADDLDDATMLAFARETKLSETAFVQAATAAGADYRNRIFSMAGEMPFAGHPSLGTAVAVALRARVDGERRYVQQTGAGLQPIEVAIEGGRARASMLQEPPQFGPELDPAPLLDALGLNRSAAVTQLPPQVVSTGLPHVILPVADPSLLGQIRPDTAAIDAALDAAGAWTLYVSAVAPGGRTAHVRAFAQSAQVLEDPATGSAAGPLCAYLHRRLGSDAVVITQGVLMQRPSRLEAQIAGDRVRVAGSVVAVLEGVLRL
jgi:trans-2,3-dihydro-3-hydroxyanthranilate isomerase